jgi:hypothetical protein
MLFWLLELQKENGIFQLEVQAHLETAPNLSFNMESLLTSQLRKDKLIKMEIVSKEQTYMLLMVTEVQQTELSKCQSPVDTYTTMFLGSLNGLHTLSTTTLTVSLTMLEQAF